MKLTVIAGAKEGTEIPLKRSKFLIGRASECSLRAGSDAISRRHCVILTREDGVSVRDLGSRNGTEVNGEKIAKETKLSAGDHVRVGPLEFRVDESHKSGARKPKVRSVAEAVDRAAERSSEEIEDDDISSWLLSTDAVPQSASETMSMKLDETRSTRALRQSESTDEAGPSGDASLSGDTPPEGAAGGDAAEAADSKATKKDKKKVGKLPSVPKKPTAKDSREAATDILREMARRR